MLGISSPWLPFDPPAASTQGCRKALGEGPCHCCTSSSSRLSIPRPHDMNKNTCLTRKEKKSKNLVDLHLPYATQCILNQRHTAGLVFHVWVGGFVCREQLNYTSTPAAIHVLWFSFTQGVRLALGSAQLSWPSQAPKLQHCPSSAREGPATPLQACSVLTAPKLLCLGGAEASQPCRLSHWAATKDQQQEHLQNQKEFTGHSRYFVFSSPKIWLQLQNCSSACLAADTPLCASPKSPSHTISYF